MEKTKHMRDKIAKYKTEIWNGIIVLLLLGQYWLKDNFVTRPEYDKDKQRQESCIGRLDSNLSSINLTLERWKTHDDLLGDHEKRIRQLENVANTYHGKK